MISIYLYGHSLCLTVEMLIFYVNMITSLGCEVPPDSEVGSLLKSGVSFRVHVLKLHWLFIYLCDIMC